MLESGSIQGLRCESICNSPDFLLLWGSPRAASGRVSSAFRGGPSATTGKTRVRCSAELPHSGYDGPVSGAESAPEVHPAFHDSFDPPGYFIAAFYTGVYHLEKMLGNLMTEGAMPSLLHEDPRYYPRSHGSIPVRVAWAVSRIVVTRTDRDRIRFRTNSRNSGRTSSVRFTSVRGKATKSPDRVQFLCSWQAVQSMGALC